MKSKRVVTALVVCGVALSMWGVGVQPGARKSVQPETAPASSVRFGLQEPKARTPGTLRLATYNVENLFDDKDDPALSGKHEDAGQTKPAEHAKAAAEAIKRIDADVVALEEVESYDAVIAFRDMYLKDAGYRYVVSIDAGDERGIEQAVLSRFPLRDAKVWVRLPLGGVHPEKWGNQVNENAGKPITFHRSPLCVTVEVPPAGGEPKEAERGKGAESGKPYELTVFVVHQKSGGPGTYWREKEAAKTVELAAELMKSDPDRNIVIVGDFNATMGQPPMRTFIGSGFTDAFYPRDPSEDKTVQDEGVKEEGKEPEGAGRGKRRGPDVRRITHESGRIIDHILFNAAALREFKVESRFVLGMPARAAGSDWRVTPPPAGYASDHYPVVVDIEPRDR
ncbi:MAG: endonuclease/exonuclease/phosphatase family protein [Phycisphaerales bacterium]